MIAEQEEKDRYIQKRFYDIYPQLPVTQWEESPPIIYGNWKSITRNEGR